MTSTHSGSSTWLTRRFSLPSAKHSSVLETQSLLDILGYCSPWILQGRVIDLKWSGVLMTSDVKGCHRSRPKQQSALLLQCKPRSRRCTCHGALPEDLATTWSKSTLQSVALKPAPGAESSGGFVSTECKRHPPPWVWFNRPGTELENLFSKEYPGDAGVAGLETTLCKPLRENSPFRSLKLEKWRQQWF